MRILLADDQVWLRTALRILFEYSPDYDVVGEAGSVQSLPSLVAQLNPDLLFLDWQLPGLESNSKRQRVIRSLRARQPNLYIIALTDDDRTQTCLLLGANALINRAEAPVPENILATVKCALCRSIDPSVVMTSDYLLH